MKHITSLSLFLLFTFNLLGQSLDIPLITTKGTAQIYVPVDEVHFNLSIIRHATEIADARKENIEISDQVVELLKRKGVPEKYIQTKSMTVGRNYLRNQRDKWEGYRASQSIYVCLTDPSLYDDIVDKLLMMDIAKLNGPDYRSSKASEAMEKARINAIVIAKGKAEQMASALGQSIGDAKLVQENFASRGSADTYSTGTSLVADIESGDQSFAPGQLVIKASVTISFALNGK